MHARTTRGYLAYAAQVGVTRENHTNDTTIIHQQLQQLDVNTTVAPAGTTMLLANTHQASSAAKEAKVSMATLLQDEKHPTGLGAYAAALSLANAILGSCVVGPQYTVSGVSAAQAELLQQWACEAFELQAIML